MNRRQRILPFNPCRRVAQSEKRGLIPQPSIIKMVVAYARKRVCRAKHVEQISPEVNWVSQRITASDCPSPPSQSPRTMLLGWLDGGVSAIRTLISLLTVYPGLIFL